MPTRAQILSDVGFPRRPKTVLLFTMRAVTRGHHSFASSRRGHHLLSHRRPFPRDLWRRFVHAAIAPTACGSWIGHLLVAGAGGTGLVLPHELLRLHQWPLTDPRAQAICQLARDPQLVSYVVSDLGLSQHVGVNRALLAHVASCELLDLAEITSLVDAFSGYSALAATFHGWPSTGDISHLQASEWLPPDGSLSAKGLRCRQVLCAGDASLRLVHDATSPEARQSPWAHLHGYSGPCNEFSTANVSASAAGRRVAADRLLLALDATAAHVVAGFPPWMLFFENAPTFATRFRSYGDELVAKIRAWGVYNLHVGLASPAMHSSGRVDRLRWYIIGVLPPPLRRLPPSSSFSS